MRLVARFVMEMVYLSHIVSKQMESRLSDHTGCSIVCAGYVACASCLFSSTSTTLPLLSLAVHNTLRPFNTVKVARNLMVSRNNQLPQL
jgi:hypothetical protein